MNTKYKIYSIATSIAVLFLATFLFGQNEPTVNEKQDETTGALLVEFSVFSGVPNPKFLITDSKTIKEILNYAKSDLPKHPSLKDDASPFSAGGLGYTGILIENATNYEKNTVSLWVYHDTIMLQDAVNGEQTTKLVKTFRKDAAKKLETDLIKILDEKQLVQSSVLAHIKGE